MHDFLIQVALLIITIVVPVITKAVLDFFKSKSKNETFKHFFYVAQTAVSAMEQSGYNGAEKKKAVELYLANKLKGVTTDDIDKLIEAAVYQIKKTAKE